MKDDKEITLDREETTWSADEEKGEISFTFETPYIWDGFGMEYDGVTILSYIDNAKYFLADIEEDAEEGYELKVKELSFIDSYGNGHSLKHYDKAADYAAYCKMTLKDRDSFKIYQLRRDLEDSIRHDLIFESLENLKRYGLKVDFNNYEEVYCGLYSDTMTLEGLYERFNINHPKDFKGHSMSVSDIVVLTFDGKEAAYYVDDMGFTSVPQFLEGKCA
jgi:hypothetical protein